MDSGRDFNNVPRFGGNQAGLQYFLEGQRGCIGFRLTAACQDKQQQKRERVEQ